MQRCVEPELLDQLPDDDPAALQSRRELRMINAIMGNHRWIARHVRRLRKNSWRVLEVGAGDGALGVRLAEGGSGEWLGAVDLVRRPDVWPQSAQWSQIDIRAAQLPAAEVVIANLVLHHFSEDELAQFGANLPSECRVVLCSEPARRPLHLFQASLLSAVMRFGHVTRHDMPVSIRAGFLGAELPKYLGVGDWHIAVCTTWLGAYRVIAQRS